MPPDLWNFALQLYARPGVEAACLALQEEGADVCLLLAARWLEARGVTCTPERCDALRNLAEPWQRDVVMPLRRLRQDWRDGAQQDGQRAALRQRLKDLELDAERALLERLAQAAVHWPVGQDEQDGWLEALAGDAGKACDALDRLRAAGRTP